jgi:20S proteasome subunit beta 7
MLAADTLGSYGSTKRYKSFERLRKVNDFTLIGAGGELSDFQYIMTLMDELATEDFIMDDGVRLTPKEVYAYLSRVMYNRRNKMDPLWNSLVVAGLQADGQGGLKPFLGTVGMIGTHYTDEHIATGFGNQLARPLFREKHSVNMSEAEAEELMKEALKVCYYRDKNSINKFQIAKITAPEGKPVVSISDPFALDTKWDYKAFVNPTQHSLGGW